MCSSDLIFADGRRLELAVDNSLGENPAYEPSIFVRYLDKDLVPIPMRKDIAEGKFNRRGWIELNLYSRGMIAQLLKPWAKELVNRETEED